MSNVVLFGAGKIAEALYWYLTSDSPHEVVAFTTDSAYLDKPQLFDRPLIPFDDVQERFPPGDFKMLIAVGYQDLNKFRAARYADAKAKGYELISYVSSKASNPAGVEIGDNCCVLENSVIQPGAHIGSDVLIWSNNHIGHHSTVQDHCFLAGHVIIGGHTTVEPYCFLGINATLGHEITVGQESFVGAGALVTKNAKPGSVYITADTPKFRLDSAAFLRLTKMK